MVIDIVVPTNLSDDYLQDFADIVNNNRYQIVNVVKNLAKAKWRTHADLNVSFVLPTFVTGEDVFNTLFDDYKDIGMDSWWRKLTEVEIFSGIIKLDDENFMIPVIDKSIFNTIHFGNGYNHLPWEVIQTYTEKLFDCISAYEFEVCYSSNTFYVNICPVFDTERIIDLKNEVNESTELQNYKEAYYSMCRGIAAYYASKTATDNFTGD